MKVKYKDIVGGLVPEVYFQSCMHCCFHYKQGCIPYDTWQCVDTIFTESKSQVFKV